MNMYIFCLSLFFSPIRLHYLQPFFAAEKLPNWTLCSALCHHMTQIQRLRSITRPQWSSVLES